MNRCQANWFQTNSMMRRIPPARPAHVPRNAAAWTHRPLLSAPTHRGFAVAPQRCRATQCRERSRRAGSTAPSPRRRARRATHRTIRPTPALTRGRTRTPGPSPRLGSSLGPPIGPPLGPLPAAPLSRTAPMPRCARAVDGLAQHGVGLLARAAQRPGAARRRSVRCDTPPTAACAPPRWHRPCWAVPGRCRNAAGPVSVSPKQASSAAVRQVAVSVSATIASSRLARITSFCAVRRRRLREPMPRRAMSSPPYSSSASAGSPSRPARPIC
jgi:hypothetical protein